MSDSEPARAAMLRHRQALMRQLGPAVDAADPDVRLLIEAHAVAIAEIEQVFETGLPELSRACSDAVAPGRGAPIPPMAIMELDVQGCPPGGMTLPRGAVLEARPGSSRDLDAFRDLKFTTGGSITARPLEVAGATWLRDPYGLELPNDVGPVASALVVALESRAPAAQRVESWSIDAPLPIFIDADPALGWPLLDALTRDLAAVVIRAPGAAAAVVLGPESVSLAGFGSDDRLVPLPDSTLAAYQILVDYFCFPRKHHGFLLHGLSTAALSAGAPQVLEIVFCFRRPEPAAACAALTGDDLRLNCVPVVNAFPHSIQSHQVRPGRAEYELTPDPYRNDLEVLRIDRVEVFDEIRAEWVECRPLFGALDPAVGIADRGREHGNLHYHATRRAAAEGRTPVKSLR